MLYQFGNGKAKHIRMKQRLGRHVYEVEVNGRMQHRHANQLRKRETLMRDDALKIMCDTFDLPSLPPCETPQAASEKANSPEPPEKPETEEVHVSPESKSQDLQGPVDLQEGWS